MIAISANMAASAAPSDDDEVAALRKEVAELRELVSTLIKARQVVPVETVDGVDNHANGANRPAALSDAAARAPIADPISNDEEETEYQDGLLGEILASRQPIGRFPDDAFVTAGEFDRSISVPGTSGSFRIGGAVQVNANYDTDNLGFQQISTQPTIPLDGDVDDGTEQFGVHTRLSRVNFDYRAPTRLGRFRTFVEFDFFGDGDEFTNDFDLRLRHAAAELGPWKFGQFWSGFVDVFNIPETADPGGPVAQPVLRNPGLYYVKGDYDGSNWGIGIENPAGDLGGDTDLIASESIPNIVGFARLQRDWGYLRIAGLGLQLKSDFDADFTGGVHISGRVNTPFTGREQNNIAFGAQYGAGFVHYFSSFVGGLDGIISEDGEVEATEILGAFLGYQHFWTDRWRSTITGSFFDIDLPAGADALAYSDGERASANLFYTPIDGVTLGLEGIYNTIETVDGSEGEGVRIEFVGRFDF
ncbi:MAG: DcaP family trimeric outer membrane transporter [Pseudomonadota bacterium]